MTAIRNEEEIGYIRGAGVILAKTLNNLKDKVVSGVSTLELDSQIKILVEGYGGSCAFFGYRGYPGNSCISINQEVVHGIPSQNKILRDGDIVSVDIGVKYEDYFADSAVTYAVGNVESKRAKLIETTKRALELGIREAYSGNFLSNISVSIQRYVEANGFSVVRDLAGHGIGKNIHEDPEIPNFGRPNCGIKLRKGMVLAIEPMVNMGDWRVNSLADGWTIVTKDNLPSAHFEHTVVILENGPEILTRV